MAEAKKAPASKAAAKKTAEPAKKAAAAQPAKKATPTRKAPAAAPAEPTSGRDDREQVLARFLDVDEVTPKAIKQWQIRRGHRPTGELTERQWAEISAASANS